jgi:hypothetical protein
MTSDLLVPMTYATLHDLMFEVNDKGSPEEAIITLLNRLDGKDKEILDLHRTKEVLAQRIAIAEGKFQALQKSMESWEKTLTKVDMILVAGMGRV